MRLINMIAALGVGAAVESRMPEMAQKARAVEQAAWGALVHPYTIVLDARNLHEPPYGKEVLIKDEVGELLFTVMGGGHRSRRHAEGKSAGGSIGLKITAYPDGENVRTLYSFDLEKGRKREHYTLGNNYRHLAHVYRHLMTHMLVFDPPDWIIEMRSKDVGFYRTERTVSSDSKEIMKIEVLSGLHLDSGVSNRIIVNFDDIDDLFRAMMLGLAFSDVVSA